MLRIQKQGWPLIEGHKGSTSPGQRTLWSVDCVGCDAGRALKRGLSGLGASHRSDGLESMQSIEDALNEEENLRQL